MVFSTYQSLAVVAKVQGLGVDPFDLVIGEAHRTTGVTMSGEDESNFVRVHDADFIKASMDDELTFGLAFHRLTFGEAVERGRLTD